MNKIMGFCQMQAEFCATGGCKSPLLFQECREKRTNVSCWGINLWIALLMNRCDTKGAAASFLPSSGRGWTPGPL